jgi:hypothetical protein
MSMRLHTLFMAFQVTKYRHTGLCAVGMSTATFGRCWTDSQPCQNPSGVDGVSNRFRGNVIRRRLCLTRSPLETLIQHQNLNNALSTTDLRNVVL